MFVNFVKHINYPIYLTNFSILVPSMLESKSPLCPHSGRLFEMSEAPSAEKLTTFCAAKPLFQRRLHFNRLAQCPRRSIKDQYLIRRRHRCVPVRALGKGRHNRAVRHRNTVWKRDWCRIRRESDDKQRYDG